MVRRAFGGFQASPNKPTKRLTSTDTDPRNPSLLNSERRRSDTRPFAYFWLFICCSFEHVVVFKRTKNKPTKLERLLKGWNVLAYASSICIPLSCPFFQFKSTASLRHPLFIISSSILLTNHPEVLSLSSQSIREDASSSFLCQC